MINGHLKKLFSVNLEKLRKLLTCAVLTLFCLTIPAYAQAPIDEILIIKSSDSAIYTEISNSLKLQIHALCQKQCSSSRELRFTTLLSEKAPTLLGRKNNALVITLGTKAKQVTDTETLNKQLPQLHALIPLSASQIGSKENHYFLVLDQPASITLSAIKKLLNSEKPIGILFSETSQWRMPSIEQAAKQEDIKILSVRTDGPDNIGKALNEILPQVSSILIIPDKTIYNRSTISQLLLTGFQNHIPFIGYSNALAKTGALASITTDKALIARDISRLVIKLLNGKTVPTISFPEKHNLVINRKILDSLNISVNPDILDSNETEVVQ